MTVKSCANFTVENEVLIPLHFRAIAEKYRIGLPFYQCRIFRTTESFGGESVPRAVASVA